MGNMSYCRFENTFRDMQECEEHMDDRDLSESENKYRIRMIEMCKEVAACYEDSNLEDEFKDNSEFGDDDDEEEN